MKKSKVKPNSSLCEWAYLIAKFSCLLLVSLKPLEGTVADISANFLGLALMRFPLKEKRSYTRELPLYHLPPDCTAYLRSGYEYWGRQGGLV